MISDLRVLTYEFAGMSVCIASSNARREASPAAVGVVVVAIVAATGQVGDDSGL